MAPLTAIEFTDHECRVIHAERGKGRASIRVLFSFELPKNADVTARVVERAQLLKEALKKRKLKIQSVDVVMPKNYVYTRVVTLPSTVDEELAGMARFEAERHIPFNAERHIVSYHVLTKQGVSGSQVLLAAVDRPVAQEYLDICMKAGLEVRRLGVSCFSLFNSFALANSAAMSDKVIAVVNIGWATTDLVIINNGMLSFTRASSLGLEKVAAEAHGEVQVRTEDLARIDALDTISISSRSPGAGATGGLQAELGNDEVDLSFFTQAATSSMTGSDPSNLGGADFSNWMLRLLLTSWLVQLVKEVKRTYEFASREFNCPPITHLYVCGEGAAIKNLPQFFKVNFGIECSTFEPLTGFDLPKKVASDVGEKRLVYGTVAGAAAPDVAQSVRVNLVPPDYLEQRQSKRQQQSWIVSGVLAVTALVLCYIYVNDVFARMDDKITSLQKLNHEMKPKVADLKDQETKLGIIRTYVTDRHGALDVLEKISELPLIPEEITLTQFEYKKLDSSGEDTVKIVGHAKTLPSINKLEAALKNFADRDGRKFFDSVSQDMGSNKYVLLPNRADRVMEYSMTATFPKRKIEKKSEVKKQEVAENSGTE